MKIWFEISHAKFQTKWRFGSSFRMRNFKPNEVLVWDFACEISNQMKMTSFAPLMTSSSDVRWYIRPIYLGSHKPLWWHHLHFFFNSSFAMARSIQHNTLITPTIVSTWERLHCIFATYIQCIGYQIICVSLLMHDIFTCTWSTCFYSYLRRVYPVWDGLSKQLVHFIWWLHTTSLNLWQHQEYDYFRLSLQWLFVIMIGNWWSAIGDQRDRR